MPVPRRRVVVLASAAVLVALFALTALVVLGVTQTAFGRQIVRDLVQEQLASRVQGKLHVGRITGGLVTGVTVDSLEIRGTDDSLFVATGPITVEYDPRDLLDRRLLLRHVRVERPVVRLRRYADGQWNFRRIFPPGPPSAPRAPRQRGFGDFVVMDSATVVGGQFLLTMPWQPNDSLRGARRDSAVAYNLAREDAEIRPVVDSVLSPDTSFARTWRWTSIDWASDGVRLADPGSSGRRFGIARLGVVESDPPFRFRNVRGEARLLGDTLWLDLPHFDLPASTGSAGGKVVWGSGLPVRYDLRVRGDSVSLADVAWVYPTLPRTGGGSMILEIRNRPGDLSVLEYALREMDVRTTRSRLRGDMTFGVGGPVLAVTDVALRADPVDFDLLRAFAGGPFPYDWQGTLTGTVRGPGGPLHRFRVDSAAIVFRDANVPGAETRGAGRGELDILDPAFAVFRGFRVDVAQLDLRTLQFVNPDFPRVGGTVAGRAVLDSLWTDVRFRDAELVHADGGGEPSRMTGSGRVTLEEDFVRYDLDVQVTPLSFTTLARSYPALPLRGPYVGPLRLRGTLADLTVATALAGPAGSLAVDGAFNLFGPEYSAVGTASATGLDVAELLERLDLPPTALTLRTGYDLRGADAASLAGGFTLDLDRSRVDSVVVYPSTARLSFGGGVMRIDSLGLASSAVALRATGGLGLVAAQPDSVSFTLAVDSLGGLRRYLQADVAAGEEADSLTGSIVVRGVLSGSTEGIGVRGTMTGADLLASGMRARRLSGDFAIADLLGTPTGPATVALDSVEAAGVRFARAELGADVRGRDAARLRASLASATGPRIEGSADVRTSPDSTIVLVDTARAALGDRRWELVRPAAMRWDRAGTTLDTLQLRDGAGGRLLAAGALPLVEPMAFGVRAEQVPLRDLGQLAQTTTSVDGVASFALDVGGVRTAPTFIMRGLLTGGRFGDVQLSRLTLDGSYAEERLRASLALARGDTTLLRADAVVPVDLAFVPRERRLLDEALSGNVRSERVDLSVLEGFTTAVRDARGTFTLNADLAGTVRRPLVNGELYLAGGAFTLPRAGLQLRNVGVDVRFVGDSLVLRRVAAASGRERSSSLILAGGIGLADPEDPAFDLVLVAQDFRAVGLPRVADLDVATTPELRLTGRLTDAVLTGGVRVDRGVIFLPEFSRKQVIDLDDPEFANVVDTATFGDRALLPGAPSALLRNLALRGVAITMGDEVWLRGPEANINLGGRVNLQTAPLRTGEGERSLALDGILTANRGTYRLNLGVVQRSFVIERGSLRFFGEPELNPTLDIVAVYTVRQFGRQAAPDVEVRAIIGGTLERPQLALAGAFAGGEGGLALSESDAVSYLVTGAPSFAIGADQSGEVTAARLALSSLGSYLGDRAAGGLFDVVQVQTSGLESGDTRNLRSAGAGILAGTRLDVGKQLSDRVFVSANAGLCQLGNVVGGSAFNAQDFAESIGIKVDYRLGSGLSLSAGVEPPTSQLFCTRQFNARGFAPTPRQWALDLFRTWRF